MIIGFFAHVDAGKTTLTESLLYNSNMLSKPGRVDDKNTVLDFTQIERNRGITIHCNGAYIEKNNSRIYLIDTPGHIDFAPEADRALIALDAAILLINASDGINSHAKKLYSLLKSRNIPTIIFVNKMDLPGVSRAKCLDGIRNLSDNSIDLSADGYLEDIASCDEILMDAYLRSGTLSNEQIAFAVLTNKITPVLFGSATQNIGTNELLNHLFLLNDTANTAADSPISNSIITNTSDPEDSDTVKFVIYRISHDQKGQRLAHIALKSGILHVKTPILGEKINEIRIYNGDKFSQIASVIPGVACAITGISSLNSGDIITIKSGKIDIQHTINDFTPVMSYTVAESEGISSHTLLERLRFFEDEMPELKVTYVSQSEEVKIMLMGEVHAQIVSELYKNRYGGQIDFHKGHVLYKETILNSVIGTGHYEPLKHYAEAQILIEPLSRGAGIAYATNLSQDALELNWQHLILTHLKEKEHLGVLTGAPITDVRYTLIGGKSHLKHTEGGDFRQAVYRAVRQGFMQAESILLEPIFSFEIIADKTLTGRIMSDIEKRCGSCLIDCADENTATLAGTVSAATIWGYDSELASLSKGEASISLQFNGYERCHNEAEIIEELHYDPEADIENTPSSIFCAHGAGHVVRWNEVGQGT